MRIDSYIRVICGTESMVNGSKFLLLPLTVFLVMYVAAAIKQGQKWPHYRTILFSCCFLCVAISTMGPLAILSHVDFKIHMICHLLLGMVAPLLLVLAAPMTLLLRTLPVNLARRLSKVLKSFPFQLFTHPVVAAILNIGGLWLLYTTNLYGQMHEYPLLHFIVHFHIFMAGYLYSLSMISMDPMPHQFPFLFRAIVLVCALGGHGILAKYIYAHPPTGVSTIQGEIGGMIMYYGGDGIEIVVIYLLCQKWFGSSRFHNGKKGRRQKALGTV